MKSLQIKTAQNVIISFTLANVGQRLFAFIADNLVKFGYVWLIIWGFNFNVFKEITNDSWTTKAISILVFLPITFYSLFSEILMNGQTLGKKLLKIKVTSLDGFKPSITDFVIRWFLRIIDFNLFILIGIFFNSTIKNDFESLLWFMFLVGKLVGLLLVIYTNKNQRFGDLIANTAVIYIKDEIKFTDTILEDLNSEYKPTYPNVIKLSDNDARIIKTTFTNAKKNNDFKKLIKLKNKIIDVTNIECVHKNDKEFISTILKDYNYYTQNM